MADISEIVQVSITANTLAVSQQGFGTMLILGTSRAFPERIRYYTSLAGVGEDFTPDEPEYQAASLAFGQDVRPAQIAIGRVLTSNQAMVTVDEVSSNFNYVVYINSQVASYMSESTDTNVLIAAGLANAINQIYVPNTMTPYVVATPDGAGGISIVPNTAGGQGDYGIDVGAKLVLDPAYASQDWDEALTEIENINSDWYAIVALSRQRIGKIVTYGGDFNADSEIAFTVDGQSITPLTWQSTQEDTMDALITAVEGLSTVSQVEPVGTANRALLVYTVNGGAGVVSSNVTGSPLSQPGVTITNAEDPAIQIGGWVQGRKKFYGTSSADPAILTDPDTTSIAALLKANNNDRTFVLYNQNATTTYPEAAWFGRMTPTQPGAATWMFKNLRGVVASPLTTTQSNNARLKNGANTYERVGGIDITRDGKSSAGQFIDIRVGVDWLESRIAERIYQRMTNLDKIPYTDAGIAVIEAELRAQLDQAVAVGLINPDYQIEVPKAANVPAIDKANRLLPDVFFTAQLSGAIHKVIVTGTVSI